MLEKDRARSAERNDSELTQNKFVVCIIKLLRIYVKGRHSRIQSVHC